MILETYYETWASRPTKKRAKGRIVYGKPQWEHTFDSENDAIEYNKTLLACHPDWQIEIRAVEYKREYWNDKTTKI